MNEVLAICGDAGGAAAVAPVIARLRQEGRVGVRALAYRFAKKVFAREGIAFASAPETLTAEDTVTLLRAVRPACLLTGTTVGDVELEKRFIAAARTEGVPSVAVVDYWSNYALRFETLPDQIAVIDNAMCAEMIAEGFAAARLVVTGAPHWDGLGRAREAFTPHRRAALRVRAGIRDAEYLVLFASQPLADMYGAGTAASGGLGYTECTVLSQLIDVLEDLSARPDTGIVLVVRPHPREQAEKYDDLRGRNIRIRVIAEGSGRDWAMASDLVTGMSTELLVEASLLGCMTVSLQPGLLQPDTLATNRTGKTLPVYAARHLYPAIAQALLDGEFRARQQARLAEAGLPGGAAARVCDLIYQQIEGRQRA